MTRLDGVLKTRANGLFKEFEEKHQLQGVVEVTSAKTSHVLLGTYEGRDGSWLARIQPAHLYDGRFRAGTFSLTIDQLDALIDGLVELRDALSDQPTNKVRIVKQGKRAPAPARQAAAAAQAPAPAPAQDPVLAALDRLNAKFETVMDRLEALEATVPQAQAAKPQADTQEDLKDAVEWQLWHNKAPFDCPACGKTYKTRGRYLTHLAEEHDIEL
jgi:hypothetical protein